MKAVILAGGFGTRLSEETTVVPKPMVQVGGRPILWHIMKMYSSYGINDFIICCGYKGYIIKEYFNNYFLHMSDVTFDLTENKMQVHQNYAEPWQVTLIDTGEKTMTGGRLKRVEEFVKDDATFCFTYGDGVGNIDIARLIEFHSQQKKLATLTATRPPARWGAIDLDGDRVRGFAEKPLGDGDWINGGFFVLSTKVFDYISGDQTIWEREPMEMLAKEDQLSAFFHNEFWQPMDTLRDMTYLEKLWQTGNAPWKTWS